jgi:hypothetical protein
LKSLSSPPSAVLFAAYLISDLELYASVLKDLCDRFGPILEEIKPQPFKETEYYSAEMGDGLSRGFIAFKSWFDPADLKRGKQAARLVEMKYGLDQTSGVHRRVNIDPGLITLSSIILSTSKNFSHRIYLGEGIFAEVTLLYHSKGWSELPWTYPDYKLPEVQTFLTVCRAHLHRHLILLNSEKG